MTHLPTDYRYTGQRQSGAGMFDGSTALYDYEVRFYDPLIATFASPDSIVPQPARRAILLASMSSCRIGPISLCMAGNR